MLPRIIGFAGYAQTGKTTLAKAIGWQRLSFAAVLKTRLAACLGISEETLDKRKHELRPALVAVGMAGRALDPNIWVRPIENVLAATKRDTVVDDCRFLNEARMIRSLGGIVVYVDRPGVGPANEDEATSLPRVREIADIEIVNDTDPAAVAARVVSFFKDAA